MKNLTLVTGGVRSGKSQFAQELALRLCQCSMSESEAVNFLATMTILPGDDEQRLRIARHRAQRPNNWKTIECPYSLPETITKLPEKGVAVIDCLSVYISNKMLGKEQEGERDPYGQEQLLDKDVESILKSMAGKQQMQFIVVTNEVGWGIVPETPLGRAFRDFLGNANQKFAARADEVWLTCAGLPLCLKPGQRS